MSRPAAILLAVLIIQCGITALLYWPGYSHMQTAREEVLVSLAAGDIETIGIGDKHGNEISLVKSAGRWMLPGLHNLPADSNRVETLLQELTTGDHGWPVARSASAHKRFQVADANLQRRLILTAADGTLSTIYLGTSPGFRKVHARNRDQEAVFSINVNSFELPAVAGNWIDPRLLQTRVPVRIDADLYTLRLEDGRWLSGGGSQPDPTELDILLAALDTLTIEGVAGEEVAGTLASQEAEVIMEVASLAGTVSLALFTLDGQHYIRSSEYPLFFSISEEAFKRLAGVDVGLISGE